jgi:pimeloyl-ACP methyl ester carboxylesterase
MKSTSQYGHDTYRVLAGRVQLFVRDWRGEGPPVVFLHSITANSLLALTLGELLNGRHRLIAPDLRGRGQSDMPFGDYGAATHLRDLLTLLDRLRLGQVVLAGHSFGAALSVFLAAEHPDRVEGLILFDGGAPPAPMAWEMLDAYYRNLQYRYPSADEYVARFKGSALYQPWTEALEVLVRSNLYQQPDGTFIRNVPRYVVEADMQGVSAWARLPALYGQVRCPVLIIRAGAGVMGTADQVLPDDVLHGMTTSLRASPSVQVVTVAEAGHTSVMTIPHSARDEAILRFLGLV